MKASSVKFRSGEMDPPKEARTTGVDARVARRRRSRTRVRRRTIAAGERAPPAAAAAHRGDGSVGGDTRRHRRRAGIAAGTMERRAIVARPSGGTRSELAV